MGRLTWLPGMLAAVLAAGCSMTPVGEPEPEVTCVVVHRSPRDSGIVTVGLESRVTAGHAPVPRTTDEALVYRSIYEPLVRRDCAGRLVPALASAWEPLDGGRAWAFTLRPEARFWDGSPVDADAVIASWTAREAPGVALSAPDARTVVIRFASPVDSPDTLARDQYSVTAPSGGWPLGTTLPAMIRHVSAGDLRDLTDREVDVVVTGDTTVAAYARETGDYAVFPLPWDRLWVVAGSGPELPPARHVVARLPIETLTVLEPLVGGRLPACALDDPPPAGPPNTVGFVTGDFAGQALAARLVGLLGAPWRTIEGTGQLTVAQLSAAGDLACRAGTRLRRPVRVIARARDQLIVRRGQAEVVLDHDGLPRLVLR